MRSEDERYGNRQVVDMRLGSPELQHQGEEVERWATYKRPRDIRLFRADFAKILRVVEEKYVLFAPFGL
jgi:hypothetical protein